MSSMTRRAFAGAAAGVPFLNAPFVHAADKSGLKRPVTGSGEYTYEVIHDWGELPKHIRYGNTHGVQVDSKGHVYVHHTVNATSESEDTMVIFDSKGKFVGSWGWEFKGGAHGLALRREGKDEFLYLCDTRRALVVKTTPKGEKVWAIEYPKLSESYKPGADGKPAKYSPTNLAVAPNGDIYVGDGYGSSFINVYDPQGGYRFSFGGKGKEQGQLDCPHGVTIDTRGAQPTLLVADRGNKRLQTFALDGTPLGISGVGEVKMPCHFDQRKEKNGKIVTLVPDLDARVTLLDESNKAIVQLGEDTSGTWGKVRKEPREAFTPGKFICPHGACFDRDGNIFVVEWVEVGRVTKLRRV